MNRSLIVDQKYEEHRQNVHKDKLQSMKSGVDNTPPPTFSHLDNRQKQRQIKSEKLSKIHQENQILVKKMAEITRKPSTIDHQNPDFAKYKKSLNKEKRQRELDKIAAENYAFVKRMIENPPSYSQTKWSEEQEKQMKYLKNATKFPVLDHHVTTGKVEKQSTQNSQKRKELLITLTMSPPKTRTSTSPTKSTKKSTTQSTKTSDSKASKPAPKAASAESNDEDSGSEDSMKITDSDEEGTKKPKQSVKPGESDESSNESDND